MEFWTVLIFLDLPGVNPHPGVRGGDEVRWFQNQYLKIHTEFMGDSSLEDGRRIPASL